MFKSTKYLAVGSALLALGVGGATVAAASGQNSPRASGVKKAEPRGDVAKDITDAKKDRADEQGEANQAPNPAEEAREKATERRELSQPDEKGEHQCGFEGESAANEQDEANQCDQGVLQVPNPTGSGNETDHQG